VFFFRKAGAAGPIKEDPIHPKLPPAPFYPGQVLMDAVFAVVLIGILAIISIKIPMELGPAANPADTHFLPRPEWYYLPAFQWLKYLSGWWTLIGGIILPALLALIFASFPFLDRRRERRPWRRPIAVGAFFLFMVVYISLGVASYRDDQKDPGVAAQMRKQDDDVKAYMQKPFVPESVVGSVPASMVTAGPKVLKGHTIFQAQSCDACHGDGGVGTAAAGPLTGVGQKYTDQQIIALLREPDSKMTNGGMTAVNLSQEDLESLGAYLRQLH
jgi:mono/diheme cytochrome c family protein